MPKKTVKSKKKAKPFRASNLPADIEGPKTIDEMHEPCIWNDKELLVDKDSVQDILVGRHQKKLLIMQIIGYPVALTREQAVQLRIWLRFQLMR